MILMLNLLCHMSEIVIEIAADAKCLFSLRHCTFMIKCNKNAISEVIHQNIYKKWVFNAHNEKSSVRNPELKCR